MSDQDFHPPVDALAAYQAGELAEEEAARLQDHLLVCRECTRTLLDLEALRFGAEPDGEAPAAEKEAFWQALRPRLAEPAAAPAPAPLPFPSRRRLQIFQALAAVLAVAVIGLGVQNASLRRTVDHLAQPDLGAPVRDLPATARRGDTAPVVIQMSPEGRFFTLVLSPADPHDFPDYEVVLAGADGREIWRGRGLKKNPYGTFSLILARRLVGAGEHTLRLSGIEGAEKRIVGEYHFRIETR